MHRIREKNLRKRMFLSQNVNLLGSIVLWHMLISILFYFVVAILFHWNCSEFASVWLWYTMQGYGGEKQKENLAILSQKYFLELFQSIVCNCWVLKLSTIFRPATFFLAHLRRTNETEWELSCRQDFCHSAISFIPSIHLPFKVDVKKFFFFYQKKNQKKIIQDTDHVCRFLVNYQYPLLLVKINFQYFEISVE